MKVWPLRFRAAEDGIIFADDAGGWFKSNEPFLARYVTDSLTESDHAFLKLGCHGFETEHDLPHTSFVWRWMSRQCTARPLAYVILIPTLRCNLSCDYCQVSRAAEGARGYDWTSSTLAEVLNFIDALQVDDIKIEFQGGEPTLRLDILEQVRTFCRRRFRRAEFVVCTNLQRLGPDEWAFLDAEDTFTSTSLDGDHQTHTRQRTQDPQATNQFFRNIDAAVHRLGPKRISALPTIDVFDPPKLDELIATYEALGLTSIYLRPVNYHGFARRRGGHSGAIALWNKLHAEFIELLIDRNDRTETKFEEYYFSHCLRRVLSAGRDHHVDIRNPNLLATDYIVIDYDGQLYPTDEARMLARIGHIDLSVGHVGTGIDRDKRDQVNACSLNNFDPDCIHCPYQPFCGTDIVDDLSRYGRVDVPRHETWFCRRHIAIFDKIFDLLYRDDERTQRALAHWAGVGAWRTEFAPVHS